MHTVPCQPIKCHYMILDEDRPLRMTTCRTDALTREKGHTKLTEIVRQPDMAQYAQHCLRPTGWQKSVSTLGTKRTSDYHRKFTVRDSQCIWSVAPINGEQFLQFTVIRDETWVNHTTFETKKSSPPAKIFKGTPLVRNILTTAFRDHKGVLLEYFLARDDTVKSDCGTSERSLDAINHKRPGPLIQNITTSQDNAMSHNTNGTCGWLWRSALRLGNYELTSL